VLLRQLLGAAAGDGVQGPHYFGGLRSWDFRPFSCEVIVHGRGTGAEQRTSDGHKEVNMGVRDELLAWVLIWPVRSRLQ